MAKSLHSHEYDCMLVLLREARKSKGVTQVELAQLLDMTQGEISRIETGQRRLDMVELRDYCRALGISFLGFVRKFDAKLGK